MKRKSAKKIGIVSKCKETHVAKMTKSIVKNIQSSLTIVADEETALKLGIEGCPIEDMDVDLILCLGGDGTILRTLQLLDKPIPILGINMGSVGFLADVTQKEAISVIKKSLNGFEVEHRARLDVSFNKEKLPYAMNEVVILTSRPAKILQFTIFVDETELETLRADGVVFATPTGSTAYAMSAGGPIVDPRVDATIIVPLAPYKLSARPSVVSATSKLRFELLQAKEAEIVVDGQFSRPILVDDVITITKSDKPAMFVKTDNTFFSKVRKKLIE